MPRKKYGAGHDFRESVTRNGAFSTFHTDNSTEEMLTNMYDHMKIYIHNIGHIHIIIYIIYITAIGLNLLYDILRPLYNLKSKVLRLQLVMTRSKGPALYAKIH